MAGNPFSNSNSRPGYGEIHVTLLPPDIPSFKTLSFTYPLKLVSSSPHTLSKIEDGQVASKQHVSFVPLVFLLSYGGGLLPPDSIFVKITLEPHTRLTLTTQGSTKIFPSPPRETGPSPEQHLPPHVATQNLDIRLGTESALLLCPDPSQPFRNSNYSQTQIVEVTEGSSLGLLDWVTSGRPARGETWVAESWKGRNEVWQAGSVSPDGIESKKRLLLRDAVYLTGGPSGLGQHSLREENVGVFGTFILYGPLFESLGTFFVKEFDELPRIGGRDWGDEDTEAPILSEDSSFKEHDGAAVERALKAEQLKVWRKQRLEREKTDGVLWTAARIRGHVLVKFGAREAEGGRDWLGMMCNQEGTIAREFGPGGLMAIR